MDNQQMLTLSVDLGDRSDIDESDLDALTRSLRTELENLPFEAGVEFGIDEEASQKSGKKMGGDLITVGSLLLAILPETLPALIGFLRDWVKRPGAVPVKIRAGAGDNVVELEFDPQTVSTESMNQMITTLLEGMRQDAGTSPTG